VLLSTVNIVTMVSPMVGARIPPDLHHQLLEVAAQLQVTPSEVIVAALRQYLERLQAPVNSPTTKEILDRLERLERRIEVLEAHPAAPPSDLEALPVPELRRLARRVIGPGGDRDSSTGKHLRRAELLAALRQALSGN
jgi:antitoxin component of RelBE/YafQ-DinJ toxin-antitoxin module